MSVRNLLQADVPFIFWVRPRSLRRYVRVSAENVEQAFRRYLELREAGWERARDGERSIEVMDLREELLGRGLLDEKQRVAVLLTLVFDLPRDEAGERMGGVTRGSVGNYVRSACSLLAEAWSE